jgi:GNAT superfamily N-acetyltransferase
MDVRIRAGRPSDHALVFDSVISTLRQSPHAKGASNAVLASLVEPLVFSPAWTLSVAHPEGDDDTVLGFILHSADAIAWVQVRAPWRRHGIGRALVRHAFGDQLPRELSTAFMVQRVGDGQPTIVDLAQRYGVTLRFRPYLPLQAALDAAAQA